MCGRYAFFLPPEQLKARLGLDNLLNIPPRYNCAPMQTLPIVVKNRSGFARWGFRPEWASRDDPAMAAKMINARTETIAEKASFKDSWAKGRRCLVPANGFFEWAKDAHTGVNQPYYIQAAQADMLYFGGLWSKVDGQVSFTILTKAADENLAHLHHRSPVMIDESQADAWFNGRVQEAESLVQQSTTAVLRFHKVGLDVGKVANDHDGLIEEAVPEKSGLLL